jgi:hypothetical protein
MLRDPVERQQLVDNHVAREGAVRAAPDARALQAGFVREHLSELVEALEADGLVAAQRLDAAAAELIASFHERERVAGQIAALLALVGRTQPDDVYR